MGAEMRYYGRVLTVLACLGLSGCITPTRFAEKADSIVEGTRTACRFVPTATSIAAILNVPVAPLINEVVEAICAEVNRQPSSERARYGRKLTVNVYGKTVEGFTAR